jgi:ferredoxin--NADP+ reductase
MTRLADYNTEKHFSATIKATERLTPDSTEEIRELSLVVTDPDFDCRVNQSFGVLVQSEGEFGQRQHHRLYSVADIPHISSGSTQLKMLVKRCFYVDEFSGEKYPGIASNYLCDRKVGDVVKITGPFEIPFSVPEDKSANLILIGMGTGIAPFRAFIKHIYANEGEWKGKIRLFYGAKTGLELLYLNEKDGDLVNYYDQQTFKAFHALSPRPHWSDPIALDEALVKQSKELLKLLSQSNTYIYIAGYDMVKPKLEKAFAEILGSEEAWALRKAELMAGKKWAEIIY